MTEIGKCFDSMDNYNVCVDKALLAGGEKVIGGLNYLERTAGSVWKRATGGGIVQHKSASPTPNGDVGRLGGLGDSGLASQFRGKIETIINNPTGE